MEILNSLLNGPCRLRRSRMSSTASSKSEFAAQCLTRKGMPLFSSDAIRNILTAVDVSRPRLENRESAAVLVLSSTQICMAGSRHPVRIQLLADYVGTKFSHAHLLPIAPEQLQFTH